MSHLTSVKIKIKVDELEALSKACKNLGLCLNLGKTSFKWYGRSVGDYPLPVGYTVDDLGKCTHAISILNNSTAYEIGVVLARDGSGDFELIWDFWNGGYGLQNIVGDDCGNLKRELAKEITRDQLERDGWTIDQITTKPNGELVIIGVQDDGPGFSVTDGFGDL